MEDIHAALFALGALILLCVGFIVFDLWIGAEIDRLGEE